MWGKKFITHQLLRAWFPDLRGTAAHEGTQGSERRRGGEILKAAKVTGECRFRACELWLYADWDRKPLSDAARRGLVLSPALR